MSKPASLPRWNTDASNRTDPASGQKDTGWTSGQFPPSSYFNWWMNLVYQWAVYVDAITAEALTWTAAHVFSGGAGTTLTVHGGSGTNAHGIDSTGGTTSGVGVVGRGGGSTSTGVAGIGGPSAGAVGVSGQGGAGGGVGAAFTGIGTYSGVVGVGGTAGGVGVSGTAGTGSAEAGAQFFGDGTGPGFRATPGASSKIAAQLVGYIDLASSPVPVKTDALANKVTPSNILKAVAVIDTDGAAAVANTSGFNVASVAFLNNQNITLTFATAFTDYTKSGLVVMYCNGSATAFAQANFQSNTTINISLIKYDGTVLVFDDGHPYRFTVFAWGAN